MSRKIPRDRIVELVRVRADGLVDNPKNWRRHPDRQRAALRGLLREEVGRNVSDQAETDEEIHALCEALIASEERSDP